MINQTNKKQLFLGVTNIAQPKINEYLTIQLALKIQYVLVRIHQSLQCKVF